MREGSNLAVVFVTGYVCGKLYYYMVSHNYLDEKTASHIYFIGEAVSLVWAFLFFHKLCKTDAGRIMCHFISGMLALQFVLEMLNRTTGRCIESLYLMPFIFLAAYEINIPKEYSLIRRFISIFK